MNYILIHDVKELQMYEQILFNAPVIGIDTETTGLDPHTHKLRLIQLAIENHPVIIIDCFTFLPNGLKTLRKIMASKSVKVFQNGKFDLGFLLALGIEPPTIVFDTMIAAHLLRSSDGSTRVSLKELVKFYLDEDLSKEEQTSDWSNDLTTEQLTYAAKDAAVLLRLREKMLIDLKQNHLVEVARVEFLCVRAIALVEFYGIKLDLKKWKALTKRTEEEQKKALDILYHYSGPPVIQMGLFEDKVVSGINMDSNKQVLSLLHQNNIPVHNTSKHALSSYSQLPLVKALTEYRRTAKLLSSFLYSMPHMIHHKTGRLHPKYAQIGAWSGRMSCGGPNIQQIPRDSEIRSCFIPEEGNKLIIADYSQIELRVVAEISLDETMIQAYKRKEDLHRLTASLVSGKALIDVTKEERQSAKAMNFGLVFGMGAKGLQSYAKETYDVDMTLEEAEHFRKQFFNAYKGVALWHKRLRTNPPRQSRTLAGRKHVYNYPGLSGLCNTPVQGTAADIIKNALGMLVDRIYGRDVKIVSVVHDEIVLEVKDNEKEEMAFLLKETMEEAGRAYLKHVPVVADVQIAESWADK